MEDAVHAIIMAFSVMVFVIALTVAVYMFQQATSTADTLLYFADETNFFDNIEILEADERTDRIVDIDTIIPTLYRYYKENFCVKIYDGDSVNTLIQVFDVNLEGEVRQAAAVSSGSASKKQKALNNMYNNPNLTTHPYYLFEAPWIGSTDEDIKTRIDYFINGEAGYINNSYVNYIDNKFYKAKERNRMAATEDQKVFFKENFIRYTYTGDTITNDDGEILVEGAQPKDKIVIIYTATKEIN